MLFWFKKDKFLLIIYMKLKTVLLFVVTLLGCCSNPLESSLMLACKRVEMNSGKVRMTAQPLMRSGKGVIRLWFFKSMLKDFFVPLVFLTFNFNLNF